MKFKLPILIVTSTILLSACQKKDNADPGTVAMQLSAPLDGQTFHSNDTVFIKANVSYGGELHGYEVRMTDTSSGFIVYDDAQHIHTDKFVIDDTWTGSVTQPTQLKLEVIAYLDHDGNEVKKQINLNLVP